jgi:hypothetical protein
MLLFVKIYISIGASSGFCCHIKEQPIRLLLGQVISFSERNKIFLQVNLTLKHF